MSMTPPTIETPQPGFGRLEAPDPGDRKFMLVQRQSSALDEVVALKDTNWTTFTKPYDQGQTGTCVGHGWKNWLLCTPIRQTKKDGPPSPFDIYDQCIGIDEFPE